MSLSKCRVCISFVRNLFHNILIQRLAMFLNIHLHKIWNTIIPTQYFVCHPLLSITVWRWHTGNWCLIVVWPNFLCPNILNSLHHLLAASLSFNSVNIQRDSNLECCQANLGSWYCFVSKCPYNLWSVAWSTIMHNDFTIMNIYPGAVQHTWSHSLWYLVVWITVQ